MARRFDAGYYFSEGFHSIFTHGFMSFAAVCMIVACLLIMGSFSLVAVNLNDMLGDLEDENQRRSISTTATPRSRPGRWRRS